MQGICQKQRLGCPLLSKPLQRERNGVSRLGCNNRAFSHEPPPEPSSCRVRRVVPLKTASVSALLKAAPFWRIAGGTAEGLPFVPIVRDDGLIFLSINMSFRASAHTGVGIPIDERDCHTSLRTGSQ